MRDPYHKGEIESGVGHAKRTTLKGLRFESLERAWAHLDRWEERWADTRIHGTTKCQVVGFAPRRSRSCAGCRWRRFATTASVNAW